MDDVIRRAVGDEPAWVVGGALRDELLGRDVVDVDVACSDPELAARLYSRLAGGAVFPLSERHGAWRVALASGKTVDFTPLRDGIEDDLRTRDFTVNAMARPVGAPELVDPLGGRADLEAERLLRESVSRVAEPAGERLLGELERLSSEGFRRAEELGLLVPLGGSLERLNAVDLVDFPGFLLVVVFGGYLERYPISRELSRFARTLLAAEGPTDDSPREVHRFRRRTEPWALSALAFLRAPELYEAVRAARASDPAEPLLRGDELGVPPGPEVGRLLELVAEERAAGTISTRDEALALVERERRGPPSRST